MKGSIVLSLVFTIVVLIIVAFSPSAHEHKSWIALSNLVIVSLVLGISSIWTVRSSNYFTSVQERSSFYYRYSSNRSKFRDENLQNIPKDPSSIHLAIARRLRDNAIVFNMVIFYLIFSLLTFVGQFLLNLLYWSGTVFLSTCSYHLNLLLLFLGIMIASLGYFVYRAAKSSSKYTCWLVQFTHEKMSIFPFLQQREISEVYPWNRAEKEMELLWMSSLVHISKKTIEQLKYGEILIDSKKPNINNLNFLIESLTASEWKNPTNILFCITMEDFLSNSKKRMKYEASKLVKPDELTHEEKDAVVKIRDSLYKLMSCSKDQFEEFKRESTSHFQEFLQVLNTKLEQELRAPRF